MARARKISPERRKITRSDDQEVSRRRQERLNAATHGVAALFSLAASYLMIRAALKHGNPWHVFSFSLFGASLFLLFSASFGMHLLPPGRARRFFEKADLSGIFLLIAGTYSPFALVTLQGALGWWIFVGIWAVTALGVAGVQWRLAQLKDRLPLIYFILGWLIALALKPMAAHLEPMGLALLIGGGLAYSLGVVFFLWTRFEQHHAIWHLFVMLGSFLHFLCVWLYVCQDNRTEMWLP